MRLGVGGHGGVGLKEASVTPVHARFLPLEHRVQSLKTPGGTVNPTHIELLALSRLGTSFFFRLVAVLRLPVALQRHRARKRESVHTTETGAGTVRAAPAAAAADGDADVHNSSPAAFRAGRRERGATCVAPPWTLLGDPGRKVLRIHFPGSCFTSVTAFVSHQSCQSH
eukprot:gene13229-biopygen10382